MSDNETLANNTEELLARLTMHEFILEIVMTNQLLAFPGEATEALRAEMLRVGSQAYGSITGDLEVARTWRRISALSNAMLERFLKKVGDREKEIRQEPPAG